MWTGVLVRNVHVSEFCVGDQNRQWLLQYHRDLKMHLIGYEFGRGYHSIDVACANWVREQRRSFLHEIKQQLVGKIGV